MSTDFSRSSGAALDRALRLPLVSGARVDVLHVLPDRAPDAEEAEAAAQLEREIGRARSAAPGCSARLVASCVRGIPYVEIIRAARARDAELLVVGVHGTREFRDLLIGSTASRVVRMGDFPVLLVRQPALAAYRNALVAVALTDADPRLLHLARWIGVERPSVVHAVHVPFQGFQAPTAAAREELRAEYCSDASAKLQSLVAAVDAGVQNTTVRAGDARAIVLEEARRLDSELLICGTHARSGIAHALLGSVTETLIAQAPCDVLVARPTRFTFDLP